MPQQKFGSHLIDEAYQHIKYMYMRAAAALCTSCKFI